MLGSQFDDQGSIHNFILGLKRVDTFTPEQEVYNNLTRTLISFLDRTDLLYFFSLTYRTPGAEHQVRETLLESLKALSDGREINNLIDENSLLTNVNPKEIAPSKRVLVSSDIKRVDEVYGVNVRILLESDNIVLEFNIHNPIFTHQAIVQSLIDDPAKPEYSRTTSFIENDSTDEEIITPTMKDFPQGVIKIKIIPSFGIMAYGTDTQPQALTSDQLTQFNQFLLNFNVWLQYKKSVTNIEVSANQES